jgi:hypothetical protein
MIAHPGSDAGFKIQPDWLLSQWQLVIAIYTISWRQKKGASRSLMAQSGHWYDEQRRHQSEVHRPSDQFMRDGIRSCGATAAH